MGTAEGVFLPLRQPFDDAVALAQGYAQGAHVSGGYYGLAGIYTSGICVDWFRATFADNADYPVLMAEAQEIPPGSLGVHFLPHLRRPNPGYAMDHSNAAFIGLTSDVSRGAAYRALLEGLAYEARYTLSGLLAHTPQATPTRITVTGGGTRNGLLLQIKASVYNRTLEVVGIEEATALGAALLGGVAAGVYPDVGAAAAAVEYDIARVAPDPALAAWYDRAYRTVYCNLGTTLAPLAAAIHELEAPP
jgi:xylulokinase